MALTQVSTGGIKDGQVHTADLADAQITAGKLHADALDRTYTLGADGSNHYTFTGEGLTGAVNDPTLYLTRGKTYRFVNGNSAGAHPFRIQTTVNGSAGTEYNTGVTNNGGAGGSTIIFEVPHDAPDVLYYQCTSHGSMGGILYVTGALADGTVTTAKLAADAVTGAKLADNAVGAVHIAADAVGTSEIVDEAVTLAKLEHGTSSNDGKFLRANNGADPTFETVSSVGGSTGADFTDDTKLRFGGSNQLEVFYGSSKGQVAVTSGQLELLSSGNITGKVNSTETAFHAAANSAVELYHNGNKRIETTAEGVAIFSTTSPTTTATSSGDELVISGDTVTGMTIHTNSSSSSSNIFFSDPDDNNVGAIRYLHNNNQIRLLLNGNNTPVMQFNDNLTIYFNGNMYSNGNSYSTGSDLRMKSNLVKFTNTLENLKKITGYKFDIKNTNTGETRKSAGLIAQEVEKVYPDFVDENPETGMKSLEYNTFIGVLVEAVKELTGRVEKLESM